MWIFFYKIQTQFYTIEGLYFNQRIVCTGHLLLFIYLFLLPQVSLLDQI
jgi:hypothetical protein